MIYDSKCGKYSLQFTYETISGCSGLCKWIFHIQNYSTLKTVCLFGFWLTYIHPIKEKN